MKFLCPSCKAKYQIGDEKVAGRSVRMKCRKCGYVIQVSSVPGLGDALPGSEPPPAPTDVMSDASAAAPPVDVSPLELEPSVPPPSGVGTPRPAPAAKSAPGAGAPAASSPSVRRPEVKKIPVVAATRPTAPKPAVAPTAPKAPIAAAPKGPPPKSSAQKPTSSPTSSPLAAKSDARPIPGASGTPLPAVAAKPATIVEKPFGRSATPFVVEEEEERTRIADVGALAGAFSLAVGGATESAGPDSLSMPADEWFVGINGVPVGPIRLSELRSKAASGSVNRESLVWRDGFEDWRPLGTFPELLAIVDESVSSARASLTPFTPSVAAVLGPAA
ncbi:MAG TPA: GYF domain-containing protein, partial [Polyangiaceae bacterium]|nr:GYF domain-containing protein [Polyangiaceae bacterium]